MQSSECPTEIELIAFHRGDLPDADIVRLATHLENCLACEQALQSLDEQGDPIARVLQQTGSATTLEAERFPMPAPGESGEPLGMGAMIVDRYTLVELLGEGGMGAVYLAEQFEPIRRLVAIKLIKPGMDSRLFLARFEAERQALALMDHPGIARVLDAGQTGLGRPFFVMELIKGLPITRYCDDHKLGLRERLELFMQVCHAVQHAHHKGVIHRDLKPSNILVAEFDGHPVPKVIDFGVAKAAGPLLTERTLVTGFGTVVGTPEYMAPEQAELNQLDVDTRSDVYSLGVLLYELLTGNTPLTRQRLGRAAILEVLRLIREEDPPKPSTRLSSSEGLPRIAADRGLEASRLTRLVKGELDWIVMKTLEKDRSRRYETADALARDIRRYLADEPIEAGRPSAAYRLRNFTRRHRGPFRFAAAASALLIGASVVSLRQASIARDAERDALKAAGETTRALGRAVAEQAKARNELDNREAVQKFFLGTIFAAGRPEGQDGGLGRNVTLRQAIDAAVPGIARAFEGHPLTEAAVRGELADTYLAVGEPKLAVDQFEETVRLRTQILGREHPDTLRGQVGLAGAYHVAGRTRDATAVYEKTLDALNSALGPENPDNLRCMSELAVIYGETDRVEQAVSMHRQILEIRKARLGPNHPDTLLSMNNLGTAYLHNEQFDKAQDLFRQTLAIRRATLGADHPDTLSSLESLALSRRYTGHWEEAVNLMEQALNSFRSKLGPDHPITLRYSRNLAETYAQAARLDAAIETLQESLPLSRSKLGRDHELTLAVMNDLATRLGQANRLAEALPIFQEVLDRKRANLGRDDRSTLRTQRNLAVAHLENGREADGARVFEEVLSLQRTRFGPADADTLQTLCLLANAYSRFPNYSRLPDAIRVLEAALPAGRSASAGSHRMTLQASANLAAYYGYAGRTSEAIAMLEQVQRSRETELGPQAGDTVEGLFKLAVAYMDSGKVDHARPIFRDYLARKKNRTVTNDPRMAMALFEVGRVLLERGHAADAESPLREALALYEQIRPDDWTTSRTRMELGGCLVGQKKYAEAEPLLNVGYRQMHDRSPTSPRDQRYFLKTATTFLARMCQETGKPDEAAKWRAETARYR